MEQIKKDYSEMSDEELEQERDRVEALRDGIKEEEFTDEISELFDLTRDLQ